MLPDRVYESGALPIALRGPAPTVEHMKGKAHPSLFTALSCPDTKQVPRVATYNSSQNSLTFP